MFIESLLETLDIVFIIDSIDYWNEIMSASFLYFQLPPIPAQVSFTKKKNCECSYSYKKKTMFAVSKIINLKRLS